MKKRNFSIIAALLALAFAMTTIGCPEPEGGNGKGEPPASVPAELLGKWINQSGSTLIVLEFTKSQLIINETDTTIYYTSEANGQIKVGATAGNIDEVFCDSFDITAGGVLTFTGGKSEDDYPSTNFYKVEALTANQWKDGAITSASEGQAWYSFNVAAETAYRMWWNDGYEGGGLFGSDPSGNGIKTLDIKVSGYYSSGTSVFTDIDSAWETARSFTPTATNAGTVYVKVTPYSSTGVPTGSFALIYSTTATERPNAPFNPSAAALTVSQWKDGEITAASNGAVWYSFSASIGIIYNIWWNESGSNGNGTKTLDVKVSGYYSDGTSLFTSADTAWSSARSITPTKGGTIYLKVMPYTSSNTGTFGIVYNTGLNTDKPSLAFNPPATPLTADEWKDGTITSGSGGVAWHSLTVTAETPYYFWWNDSYGNGIKTLDISVTAYDSEGTVIAGFSSIDSAWATAKSYTPTASGTLYLRVTPYTSGQTGTYGIVYSETNTRPVAPFNPPNPIALDTDVWADGELPSSVREVWYSISVTGSTTYRVWWNDSYAGDSTKTGDVSVRGFYSDGTSAFSGTDSGWTTARSFTPPADGTVYLRVTPTLSNSTGTFGIVYSDNSTTRPPLPVTLPSNTTPLTAGTWADGFLTSSVREVWYSFDVASGSTYNVWWNESGTPGGTKTLNITVSAWYGNGTNIFNDVNNGWYDTEVPSFTPDADGTVYVKVTPYNSSSNGTFGIAYTIDPAARPLVPITPFTPTTLTVDTWADGEITIAGVEVWYSFAVTNGTSYRIWLNEGGNNGNGLKTLDVTATVYYANGNFISTLYSAWSSASSAITPDAADTVYIRIAGTSSYSNGTFGVAYSTSNDRPALSFTPPTTPTPLTAGEWMDGSIDEDGEVWYSLTIPDSTNYYVWWNESGTNGNNTKTANIRVSAWRSDWNLTTISNTDTAWTSSANLFAGSGQGGTVYIRVTVQYSDYAGTFGIVYDTTNTRPVITP